MPSVTIDAGVLAAPAPTSTREAVYNYVEILLDWKQLIGEPWVSILMSQRAAEVLIQSGFYPMRDRLKNVFRSRGVQEYDFNTVARLADTLLRITPSFEEHFSLHDVLTSELKTDPDLLSMQASEGLSSDLGRCIVLFSLLRHCCRIPITDHALVVKPYDGPGIVRVSAKIHDLEHHRDDIETIPMAPETFEGSMWICKSFTEFLLALDESSICESARDDLGVTISIQIALFKSRLGRGLTPIWGTKASWSLGNMFVNKAKDCAMSGSRGFSERLLRSIVEAIDHLSLADTHPIRTDEGGGAPQLTRGVDKAWRRDIDHEYHLHYWESPEGRIELAAVVSHNDLWIPL